METAARRYIYLLNVFCRTKKVNSPDETVTAEQAPSAFSFLKIPPRSGQSGEHHSWIASWQTLSLQPKKVGCKTVAHHSRSTKKDAQQN